MAEDYSEIIERRRYGKKNYLFSAFVYTVLIVILIVTSFRLFVSYTFQAIMVEGNSMLYTLHDGDIIYANRHAEAERGDIIIIDVSGYPEKGFTGDLIVKRLIATGGDSVFCCDGVLYLKKSGEKNYEKVEENYIGSETSDFSEVTVPQGGIFFLGDNRKISFDSRGEKSGYEKVGCLKEEDIVGVVSEWWSKNMVKFKFILPIVEV